MVEACNFDENDCLEPDECFLTAPDCAGKLGDGFCDMPCAIPECEYDEGDCTFPNEWYCD